MQRLQLLRHDSFERGRRVAPEMTNRLVVLGPEKWECRHRDDRDAAGLELSRHPAKGCAVVLDVLQDVEHAENVEEARERLGDGMVHYGKSLSMLPAQIADGIRVALGAEHVAEACEHR